MSGGTALPMAASGRPVTFRAGAPGPDVVARLGTPLGELGIDVADAVATEVRVLDTFDGRLAARGLRLTVRRGEGDDAFAVTLSGRDAVAVTVATAGVPSRADDLPAGPLRRRVAEALGIRALVELVVFDCRWSDVARRDADGKIDVAATLIGGVTVGGSTLDAAWLTVAPLTGYEAAAREVIGELAARLGHGPRPGDASDAVAAAIGADLVGTRIEPGIPLDGRAPALAGFRAVLGNLQAAVVANRPGVIADVDTEFLHDLRVAVRRSRVVLGNARGVIDPEVLARARAGFARLGDLTGPARDLDVYQLEWSSMLDGLDPTTASLLEPVHEHLAVERAAAQAGLAAELAGAGTDELVDWWSAWLAGEDAGSSDAAPRAGEPLGPFVERRIRRAYRRLVRHGRAVTAESPAERLHEVRKDAKKLRYLIECFGSLFEPGPRAAFLKRLKTLQEVLGEHQDAAVHVRQLRDVAGDLAGRVPVETVLAVGQLVERMDDRRRAGRARFEECFAGVDTPRTRRALRDLLADGRPAGSGR